MSDLGDALQAARACPSELHEALAVARGEGRATVSLEQLISGFDSAIGHESDSRQRARLLAVVATLRDLGRDFAIDVAAHVVVQHIGI